MGQKRVKSESSASIAEYYKMGVCPYSDDCFKCKTPDCMVQAVYAHRVNKLHKANKRRGE